MDGASRRFEFSDYSNIVDVYIAERSCEYGITGLFCFIIFSYSDFHRFRYGIVSHSRLEPHRVFISRWKINLDLKLDTRTANGDSAKGHCLMAWRRTFRKFAETHLPTSASDAPA